MSQVRSSTQSELKEIIELLDSIDVIEDKYPHTKGSLRWLFRATGHQSPQLNTARLAIFMANYGFSSHFPSSSPSLEYVNLFVQDCYAGTQKLNRLCEHSNSDLRLYELTTESFVPDIIKNSMPSQTAEELVRAMSYGMLSLEQDINLMAGATFGAGAQDIAQAIIAAHTPPSSLQSSSLIGDTLLKHNKGAKGMDCLLTIGGAELSALCGAIISARLAGVPIILDGMGGYAALLILAYHCPHIVQHCALTGKIAPNVIPQNDDLLFIPPPYEYISSLDYSAATGISSVCLIPMLKNEILVSP
ncbi:MAG: nicotinate-nucleotide--dimethylbenzimidazole phosphoribosyltransferase [Alphaproteobacteria bacterium]|jgi:NaMN:DMB phosphoribosyltransferase|nr:nicotinate-nucleotide--dimethylbenzimidazole phosphoribosyltransferase [Alphaproteobacteria bacterium]MCB1551264.1 nicotinate-nucleotide--dimethylbenzimidazole phosphoribosyltransferase [Alphaproteobacteria bacterium]MCB9984519.1 nicotinate-nucleotide--dimethylbenzimidazole phosphoribosyltransferase [Micavibrio sp.]HRK97716.1 nicotinate-nucleotide--dimethylbenzimidazole phosphoribosyltransferase [Alphaproteobacteria bacterium]